MKKFFLIFLIIISGCVSKNNSLMNIKPVDMVPEFIIGFSYHKNPAMIFTLNDRKYIKMEMIGKEPDILIIEARSRMVTNLKMLSIPPDKTLLVIENVKYVGPEHIYLMILQIKE